MTLITAISASSPLSQGAASALRADAGMWKAAAAAGRVAARQMSPKSVPDRSIEVSE